jgi:hypothetical protein
MGYKERNNVRKTKVNQQSYFDGLYQPFVVKLGMAYCFTNIIKYCLLCK